MHIGQLLSDRYKVIKKIGSGSFGDTYIATDTKFPGEPYRVVKHLCPKDDDPQTLKIATRLFETEAKSLAKLGKHDRIPELFAYFDENNEFFLVQELVEGKDLTEEFKPERQWSEAETIEFLQELLSVLSVVHQQNTIHRDIKPANIMRRDRDRKLVLIDFGAVKEVATVDREGNTRLPDPSVGIGTMAYMPPEQAIGRPGTYSDVYAVGMIGIQALTGLTSMNLPHDPDEFKKTLAERQIEISPNLQAFLSKAISYQFKDRYQDATEALNALTPGGFTPDPIPPSKPDPEPTHIIKTFPKKLLLGALTVVAVIGGVGTYFFQSSNKPNYTQLESYLQAKDWRQADAETDKILLQVAKRDDANTLDTASIREFPCEALKKIDDLWMTNSDRRFGFTPQKEIYSETGNEFNDYNQSTYEAFGDRLGWRIFGVWGLYKDIKFTDIAPMGHLPAPGRVGEKQKDLRINERGSLLSRFDACGF
ncbi:MAG: serine/threonine-protein kinase [Pleurocapsa sp. MO_226.B13]|nr:serine/threonine-protein kinase [Pleurocapsa sp. MO_226.B13]